MKTVKWIAVGLAVFIAITVTFIAWSVGLESGARWVANRAQSLLDARLEIGSVEGTIAGPLILTDLRYRGAAFDLSVQRLEIDFALSDLYRMRVNVRTARLSGIDLTLQDRSLSRAPGERRVQRSFDLQPPVDLIVESVVVHDAEVYRGDEVVLRVNRGAGAGSWTAAGLRVERLDLHSPAGEVHLSAHVDQEQVYVGEGRGRFRWRVGDRTYAGELRASTHAEEVHATAKLTSPLEAQVQAVVEPSGAWPWRFTFEAPQFDPREKLMPAAHVHNLAASLHGSGTATAGVVAGRVLINDEPLILDHLRFTRGESLSIESELSIGANPGELRVGGTIDLEAEPWIAQLEARWQNMIIPVAWSWRELQTRGELDVNGSFQTYHVDGALALGPSGEMADLAIKLRGTPEVVHLEQLDIVQESARLNASGRFELKPLVTWNVRAQGHDFDPGAFAAAWRGSLGFQLESEGRVTQDGPAATLQLMNLSGTLRGRPVSGVADLLLTPASVLSGTMTLRSGDSELRFRGAPGEQIDATLSADIASLDDWLPGARGKVTANAAVRGRWPALSIKGEAHGSDLRVADARIGALTLNANIDDARRLEGSVRVDLGKISAWGFEFATVRLHASRAMDIDRLQLRATGEPLSLEVRLHGARTTDGWSGSLQHLLVAAQDAARLRLREPVRVEAMGEALRMSLACLADGEIELCFEGSRQADGALQATYSMDNVPLALAHPFAPADWPLQITGFVQGRGEVRRTPEGELFGDARIHSPSGRISKPVLTIAGDTTGANPSKLLGYRDLVATASLAGSDVRASLSAKLEPRGRVRGEATLRRVGQSDAELSASLNARVPDLAAFAVFTPQFANVHGRLDVQLNLAGPLRAPTVSGRLLAADLAAEVPAIGLHLQDGRLEARPDSSGTIAISGGVASGGGRLVLEGTTNATGTFDLNINGDRFLAADIPAARVFITPDLTFVRADGRMRLSGEVRIPEATVNVQRLPRGPDGAQRASPDVVVIDARTREEEIAETPLFVDVAVILGEEVQLTGFGLQAQLDGRLVINESPGEPTIASGVVRASGTYQAYGQDLTIQRGQLLYAASPLSNPRLDIEATRKIDGVTAGLRIRGHAQAPELTVFSDPAMGQANALSYLVAGKPLDDIGASGGEGDAVQAAARSLGSALGGLLAKRVGGRLALDELAVTESEVIGGAALTVGEYLSPRLYLSYSIGLFEPGDVVTLSYELTEDLALKVQKGSEHSRAGIEYRIER